MGFIRCPGCGGWGALKWKTGKRGAAVGDAGFRVSLSALALGEGDVEGEWRHSQQTRFHSRETRSAVRGLIAHLGLDRKRATSARTQQRSGCKTAGTATAKHCLYPSGQPQLASKGAEAVAADLLMRWTLEFAKRLRRERSKLAQSQQS